MQLCLPILSTNCVHDNGERCHSLPRVADDCNCYVHVGLLSIYSSLRCAGLFYTVLLCQLAMKVLIH